MNGLPQAPLPCAFIERCVMTDQKTPADPSKREWVELEISELAVEETMGFPGRGGDGGRFVDCTRS